MLQRYKLFPIQKEKKEKSYPFSAKIRAICHGNSVRLYSETKRNWEKLKLLFLEFKLKFP